MKSSEVNISLNQEVMQLWHPLYTSQVTLIFSQIWGQLGLCRVNKGEPICPWDGIPMAQTLFICPIRMYEVVWGGYQPLPWDNDIIPTPQVTRIPKSGANLVGVMTAICPWDSITMAQTLYIYLTYMYEAVWGGYQPQTWHYGIIFTPQVTPNFQILINFGEFNCTWVHPHAFETAYQWLKHFR